MRQVSRQPRRKDVRWYVGLASPFATTVAGIFCIPATGSPLVNALADLPGPAAVSVSGMTSIQLF